MSESKSIDDMITFVNNNNIKEFNKYINNVGDINETHDGMTMLGHALSRRRDYMVEKLFAFDTIDVDKMDTLDTALENILKGNVCHETLSPLHCAIISGSLHFVKHICKQGDETQQQNRLQKYCKYKKMFLTPFQTAILANEHAIYVYLKKRGEKLQVNVCFKNVLHLDDSLPTNVLELAASYRYINTVKYLLSLYTYGHDAEKEHSSKVDSSSSSNSSSKTDDSSSSSSSSTTDDSSSSSSSTTSWKQTKGSTAFLTDKSSPVYCKIDNKQHPMFIAISNKDVPMITLLRQRACPLVPHTGQFYLNLRGRYQPTLKTSTSSIKKRKLEDEKCCLCLSDFKDQNSISQATKCSCTSTPMYHTQCLTKLIQRMGVQCPFCQNYFHKHVLLKVKK